VRPIPATLEGGGAHEECDFGALCIADTQLPPDGELPKRVWSQAAPTRVDMEVGDKSVKDKERRQSSAALAMLRWHSMDYHDELAAMTDNLDTDELMQGCNPLTLIIDGSQERAGCSNSRGMPRAPRQCPSPRTASGGIRYDCSCPRHRREREAASRFLIATKAEAALSQHELQALGYTDCDLSYLIRPAASCCRA
jgi:hypothetical protein